MRELILTGAIACALCSGACAEDYIKGKSTDPAKKTVIFEEAGGPGEKAIDAGGPPVPPGYPNDGGVDDAGRMPPNENYDEDTGLQNLVPSDSYGRVDR